MAGEDDVVLESEARLGLFGENPTFEGSVQKEWREA